MTTSNHADLECQKCGLIWKWGLCRLNFKLRSYWIRVNLNLMTDALIWRSYAHTQGWKSCDDRGRDCSYTSASQGTPRIYVLLEAERHGKVSPLEPPSGHDPVTPWFRISSLQNYDFYKISIVSSHSVCGTLLQNPNTTSHMFFLKCDLDAHSTN